MTTPHIAYFGYGSLVNLATLQTPYIAAFPATLKGWRRVWLARPAVAGSFAPSDGLAFLSAERAENSEIDGVLVIDEAASLAALDEREALYDRVDIEAAALTLHGSATALAPGTPQFLYMAKPFASSGPDNPHILRSYLDAVSQGYLGHFGQEGLERFISTTRNFHYPFREDRAQPIYPRPITLLEDEREVIDRAFPQTSGSAVR